MPAGRSVQSVWTETSVSGDCMERYGIQIARAKHEKRRRFPIQRETAWVCRLIQTV